jgi:hypothetical protein
MHTRISNGMAEWNMEVKLSNHGNHPSVWFARSGLTLGLVRLGSTFAESKRNRKQESLCSVQGTPQTTFLHPGRQATLPS